MHAREIQMFPQVNTEKIVNEKIRKLLFLLLESSDCRRLPSDWDI